MSAQFSSAQLYTAFQDLNNGDLFAAFTTDISFDWVEPVTVAMHGVMVDATPRAKALKNDDGCMFGSVNEIQSPVGDPGVIMCDGKCNDFSVVSRERKRGCYIDNGPGAEEGWQYQKSRSATGSSQVYKERITEV